MSSINLLPVPDESIERLSANETLAHRQHLMLLGFRGAIQRATEPELLHADSMLAGRDWSGFHFDRTNYVSALRAYGIEEAFLRDHLKDLRKWDGMVDMSLVQAIRPQAGEDWDVNLVYPHQKPVDDRLHPALHQLELDKIFMHIYHEARRSAAMRDAKRGQLYDHF